ncbi:dynamin family protein [Pseudonocardia sp. HH130630-07]|uniref:dynamin family protein n=1 Tax=Pseudonocardia sp. HH130630-07 TaxID=1690815 RepID=UPI000814FB03|nr:dynamin family protein [Pseudonocardia sp. HH130630-07]ANY06828.1 GTP-binding protein [Pseudonocardia sp. HH130630-07]
MSALTEQTRALLRNALTVYGDSPQAAGWLRHHLDRFDEPLRVAIAGKVKAGKSTLLNALVGERIAPTDAGECTRIVTWYADAPAPGVRMRMRDPAQRERPLTLARRDGALRIDLQGTPVESVDRLLVDWPSQHLRHTNLIDTPGIASLTADTSARAGEFLTPEDSPSPADAVVYLMRHLHAGDVRFLESFHDRGVARATPVNTIAVLSRADEIGVGRLDALTSARRIARRYRGDDKLRGLCQTVVAVAGLVAETARTLRQDEFVALSELAALPRADVEALLLSADRFGRSELDRPDSATRVRLLDRFGLFGVRLASTLIRQGVTDPTALADELVRRSGLDELRGVLDTQFAERRDLLKSRSALLAVDLVLTREPRPATAALRAEVERILAGAHEFVELRALADLRAGKIVFPPEALVDAERLLGGDGGSVAARLGLDDGVGPREVHDAAAEALRRWRRRAESPLTGRASAEAARIVVRSCEGLLAAPAQHPAPH